MQKIIGVTDLQRRLKAVLDEVADEHVPYVLIRGSQPRAALVPYEQFLRFQELSRKAKSCGALGASVRGWRRPARGSARRKWRQRWRRRGRN